VECEAYSSGVSEKQKKIALRALCAFAVNYYNCINKIVVKEDERK
jgi:hypothetical protein